MILKALVENTNAFVIDQSIIDCSKRFLFFIITLFNYQLSIHILCVPSFFFTNITSVPHGDEMGLINLLASIHGIVSLSHLTMIEPFYKVLYIPKMS